jgi:hypothetical protein
MDAAKVEVTLWWHICYICGHLKLLAILPYPRRCIWVINGGEHHGNILLGLQINGQEDAVNMRDLLASNPVGDLLIQAGARTGYRNLCVGIEEV